VLVCVVVAYGVMFLVWLAWAPFHFRYKPYGGILAVLKRRGIRRMWPQYLMVASGILFFVALIGFLQINVVPPKKGEPSKTAESPKVGSEWATVASPLAR
jgi:hypothetical protein